MMNVMKTTTTNMMIVLMVDSISHSWDVTFMGCVDLTGF